MAQDYLWRLRDEILYRKKEGRVGGYYKSYDTISRKSDKWLEKEEKRITNYRMRRFGYADS